ncbi:MAG: hypothetical protein FWF94_00230 [Oscillospiraceae bacterium]|nr:hypothetical protein [Oscillospiraceae bacterium]
MKHIKRVLMNRKLVAVILAAAMVVSVSAFAPTILPNVPIVSNIIGNSRPDFGNTAGKNAEMPSFRCGDVNGDGEIAIFDFIEILVHLVGMSTSKLTDTSIDENERIFARRASLLTAATREGASLSTNPAIFDGIEILMVLVGMSTDFLCNSQQGCKWCNACLECTPFPGAVDKYPDCDCAEPATSPETTVVTIATTTLAATTVTTEEETTTTVEETTTEPATITTEETTTEQECPGDNTKGTCLFIPWCALCDSCGKYACDHDPIQDCLSGNENCKKLGCEPACAIECKVPAPDGPNANCTRYQCQPACVKDCPQPTCEGPWSCMFACDCTCDQCFNKPTHRFCYGQGCPFRICQIGMLDHPVETHGAFNIPCPLQRRSCEPACEVVCPRPANNSCGKLDCQGPKCELRVCPGGVPTCILYDCQNACNHTEVPITETTTEVTTIETTVTTIETTVTTETTPEITTTEEETETTPEDTTTDEETETTPEDTTTEEITTTPDDTTVTDEETSTSLVSETGDIISESESDTTTEEVTTTTEEETTTIATTVTTTPATTTTPEPTTPYECEPACIPCPDCESVVCGNQKCIHFDCTCLKGMGQRPVHMPRPKDIQTLGIQDGKPDNDEILRDCQYPGCSQTNVPVCPRCTYCRDCDWYYFGTVHCDDCGFGSDCIASAQCTHGKCQAGGICLKKDEPEEGDEDTTSRTTRNDWCTECSKCRLCCGHGAGKMRFKWGENADSLGTYEKTGATCAFSDEDLYEDTCQTPYHVVKCNVCAGENARFDMCISCAGIRYGIVVCKGCGRHSDCISGSQTDTIVGSRAKGWCKTCGYCKIPNPPYSTTCCKC